MKLYLDFRKNIPPVTYESSESTSRVFEIYPKGGSSKTRKEVSIHYLLHISNAVKGVTNNVDDEVQKININIPNINLNIEKQNSILSKESIIKGDTDKKYDTIIA